MMESTNKLYRVVVKTTNRVQPNGTYWDKECIYCGGDLREAKRIYYREEVLDFGGCGHGGPARETVFQVIEPGQDEEDLASDTIRELN